MTITRIALMVKCRNALRKLERPVDDPAKWSMVAAFIRDLEGGLWVAAKLLRGMMRDPRNDAVECERLAEKIEKIDGLAARFENWDNLLDEPGPVLVKAISSEPTVRELNAEK